MFASNRTRRPAVAAAALAAALAACSDTSTNAVPEGEPTLAQQVAALGFRSDMIEDHGDFVLVEGDIMLTREQLRAARPAGHGGPMVPSFQYHTHALVGSPKVHEIRVDVSGLNSEPGWQAAAREALGHWSGISNSYVRLVEGWPADITVTTTCTASYIAAYASWPGGGNPGSTVHVNVCFGYSTSHAQKVHNMVHEFGHTLGFRHSNFAQIGESAGVEGAVHVPGTPTSGNDPGSVMNGGTALNSWAGFSAADLTATRSLYPLPKPVVSVSNSGGTPLVSWGALTGATNYTVGYTVATNYTNRGTGESYDWTDDYPVGSTTGNSILDAARTYTGVSFCSWSYSSLEIVREFHRYQVHASFPNGTSTSTVAAPVAQC